MPRIFISTTEPSAERHAAHLARELRTVCPDLRIDAAGTEMLEKAGARLVVDMSGHAVMGFVNALSHIVFFKKALDRIVAALGEAAYDALVVVDSPSFHLPLARRAHTLFPGLPIVYYIAPQLWAWKKWRAKNLRRDFAKTLCLLPFEEPFFRGLGVDATYVGNPTLDQIRGLDAAGMAALLGTSLATRHSEPLKGVFAVFPGSRASEVKHLWPAMAKTIAVLRARHQELKPAVALAPGWDGARLAKYAAVPDGAALVSGASQELLAASSLALVKSGTTALEAALCETPMVVAFAANVVNAAIAYLFIFRMPHISLPNIVAGREVVKELLQFRATAKNFAAELELLLADADRYRAMRVQLGEIRNLLGEERAAARAAAEIRAFFR